MARKNVCAPVRSANRASSVTDLYVGVSCLCIGCCMGAGEEGST
jgi:hypothetical protein